MALLGASATLVQLDGVAIGILDLNLRAAWPHFDRVAEVGTRRVQLLDLGIQIGDVSAARVAIGVRHSGNEAFNGAIDNVRIYNRVLTTAEVQAPAQQ